MMLRVQALDAAQMLLERLDEGIGQHRHAVLIPFGVAHEDGAALAVQVLHAQTEGLRQAQAVAVEQLRQQLMDAGELGDNAVHFFFGEHGRQIVRLAGPHCLDGVSQLLMQDVAVEEEERGEGLVWGGGGDMPCGRQVGEKGRHLGAAELTRMAMAVVVNEALDPVQGGLLGADGIVFAADRIPHDIEELFLGRLW